MGPRDGEEERQGACVLLNTFPAQVSAKRTPAGSPPGMAVAALGRKAGYSCANGKTKELQGKLTLLRTSVPWSCDALGFLSIFPMT